MLTPDKKILPLRNMIDGGSWQATTVRGDGMGWYGMGMSQGGKLPSLLSSLGVGVSFSWLGSVLTRCIERWDSGLRGRTCSPLALAVGRGVVYGFGRRYVVF